MSNLSTAETIDFKAGGCLQPLPVPSRIWEDISLDFVEGLPKSQGMDTILVIVDRLSKYAHFIGLSHPFSAPTVAMAFIKEIVRLHGFPSSIVSDRDRIFMSLFWQEIFRVQGTALLRSTAYHPQTDGQTEVVNKTLESYLRCFIQGKPRNWEKWLSWAEFWYNTSAHVSTKFSPFEIVYGRPPPALVRFTDPNTAVASLEEQLLERDAVLDELKFNLTRTQQRMRMYADQHRREMEYNIGDLVYVKLQPYRQHSLARRPNDKLSPRYYGPFLVLDRVGLVAYRLQLPPSAKIHNILHISRLRKAEGTAMEVQSIPPQISADKVMETIPEQLLWVRNKDNKENTMKEVLIKWQDLPIWEATWEYFEGINLRFPNFHLEDKVAVWVPGIATTPQEDTSLIKYVRKKAKGQGGLYKGKEGAMA